MKYSSIVVYSVSLSVVKPLNNWVMFFAIGIFNLISSYMSCKHFVYQVGLIPELLYQYCGCLWHGVYGHHLPEYSNQGPISRMIFPSQFKISFWFHPSCVKVIAMKLCTWHDNCAIMTCAKFGRDLTTYNWATLKPVFHWIWITMETLFVKWAPV